MGVYCDLMNEQNVNRTMIINLECVLDPREDLTLVGLWDDPLHTVGERHAWGTTLNQQVKVMSG